MHGLFNSQYAPRYGARLRALAAALLLVLLAAQSWNLSAQKQGQAEEARGKLDSLETALSRQSGEAALETRLRISQTWFSAFSLPKEERSAKFFQQINLGLDAARQLKRPDFEARFFAERARYLKWQPDSIAQALAAANAAVAAARTSGSREALARSYNALSGVYLKFPGNEKTEAMTAAGEKALEYARAAGNKHLLADICSDLQERYRIIEADSLAARRGEEAFALYTELGNAEQAAILCRGLSFLYSRLGDERKQVEYLEKFFALADNLNYQTNQIAGAWLEAGNIARANYQPEQALYFYRKCYRSIRKDAAACDSFKTPECRQHIHDLGVISFNMADAFRQLGRPDSNRAYLRRGVAYFEREGSKLNMLLGKLYLAASRARSGEAKAALADLAAAEREIKSRDPEGRYVFGSLHGLIKGIALSKADRPEEALPILRQSIKAFINGRVFIQQNDRNDGVRTEVGEAYAALEAAYLSLGKPDSARLALESRAYLEQRKLAKIISSKEQESLDRFDLKNKNKEISGLTDEQAVKEAKISRRRAFIWSVSGGAAVFALLLVLAALNVRAKRRANRELVRQKAEISSAFEEIRQINESLKEACNKIEKQHEDLSDSIIYARRIQRAALPRREYLYSAFPRHFLYYKPRDVISGDFYWFAGRGALRFIAVCDCTGHGVPGGVMSILGASRLDSIVHDYGIDAPEVILSELDRALRADLRQHADAEVMDSIDVAFCVINPETRMLYFSGAGRPLWLVRDGKVVEYKGERFSAGGSKFSEKTFTAEAIPLQAGDRLYLFSDGITDQFGGERKRKFARKRLRAFIEKNSGFELPAQGEAFRKVFDQWRAPYDQLDDMTLLALEL